MLQKSFFLVAVLLIVTSIGCGTHSGLCKPNSTFSVIYADQNPNVNQIVSNVQINTSTVCVVRIPQFVACAAPMFIQMGGKEIGPLATHTHYMFQVSPGEHEFSANKRSLWTSDRSYHTKVRLETYPGRAYFLAAQFDEGTADIRQISKKEAQKLISDSRMILTDEQRYEQ